MPARLDRRAMLAEDLNQAVALGQRRGLTIQRLGERFADTGQIGVKATERVAGAVVGLVAP